MGRAPNRDGCCLESAFGELDDWDRAFWALRACLSFSVSAHFTTKGTVEPYSHSMDLNFKI